MGRRKITPELGNSGGSPSLVSEPAGLNLEGGTSSRSREATAVGTSRVFLEDIQEEEEEEEGELSSGNRDVNFLFQTFSQKFKRTEVRQEAMEARFSAMEKEIEFLVNEAKGKTRFPDENEDFNQEQAADGFRARYTIPPRRNSNTRNGGTDFPFPRNPKFKISSFSGDEDVVNWLRRVNHHFTTNEIEENLRVPVAVYYLDGRAMSWWSWMSKRGQGNLDWQGFSSAIKRRFGPKPLDDSMEQLNVLRQTGSVESYHDTFTALSNEVNELPDSIMLSCYISGLKYSIRLRVKAAKPRTVMDAYELALVREAILEADKKELKSQGLNTSSSFKNNLIPNKKYQQQTPNKTVSGSERSGSERGMITKSWTPNKVQEYKEKGLCFYCDQKYSRGHTCPGRGLYSMEMDYSDNEGEGSSEEEESEERKNTQFDSVGKIDSIITPGISLNALTGCFAPNTIRLSGTIKRKGVTVLIDTGSTHNFIDPQVAREAGLQMITNKQF